MPEFIARDPDSLVMGFLVQSYIAAIGEDGIRLAEELGLTPIEGERWYRLQALFDLLKKAGEAGTMNSTLDLVKVGMRMGEMAMSAINLQPTITEILLHSVANHQAPHQGEVGSYEIQFPTSTHGVLIAKNDYPCDVIFGAFYTLTRLTRPAEMLFSITHREGTCRKHGGDHCIYDIKWWEESDEEMESA